MNLENSTFTKESEIIDHLKSIQTQNKKLRFFVIFLTFLSTTLFGLLLSCIYRLAPILLRPPVLVITPSPLPTILNQTDNVIPSDWKTYENTSHHLKFKYPSYFIKNQENEQGIQLVNSDGYQSNILIPDKYLSIGFNIITSDNKDYLYLKSEISKKSNYTVDGFDAYKIFFNKNINDPTFGYEIYFVKSDILFRMEISTMSEDLALSIDTNKLIDQILSTFKFSDNN